jgi:putative FmdB family regulatory protein
VRVVPTYEYHCDGCGRDFEVKQRISEDPLTVCEQCGGAVRRLISPAPFILKGEGWYVTDYPSAARKQAMESEKGTTKSTAAGDKGGGEKSAPSTDSASPSSSASSSPSASSSSAASSD